MSKIIAFNKPFDVHSQFRGEEHQLTLAKFIHDKRLRIAGRLDRDSEGLLLLTDDGKINQHITHPRHKQYKCYVVQVEGIVSDEAVQQLRQGIMLKDGKTLPAKVKKITQPDWLWQRVPPIRFRANIPTSWLEIQICEGRNRQIRRMTAAVGFPTLRLIRTQIGSVCLLDLNLALGESCPLNLQDYAEFRALLSPADSTPHAQNIHSSNNKRKSITSKTKYSAHQTTRRSTRQKDRAADTTIRKSSSRA